MKGSVTAARNTEQWHQQRRAVAQAMVRNEHTHRLQVARIDRVQEIYRKQGRMDRVRQLDQLRTQLQDRYREQDQDCQEALGDRDHLRLKDRIQDHTELRDRDRQLLRDGDRTQDRDRDRLDTPDRDRDRDRDRDPISDPDRDRDRDQTSKPKNL